MYKKFYMEEYGYLLVGEDGDIISKTGKHLHVYTSKDGYKYIKVTLVCRKDDFRQKAMRVHRLVALCYVENPYNYNEINHIDGNKNNNHYSNLEWCTHKQNMEHCFRLGLRRNPIGSKNVKAKLKEEQVLKIRKLYANGVKTKKLMEMFNVSKGIINDITARRTWKHI